MTIKKVFEEQINDIIELKDEKMEACSDGNTIIYKKRNPLYVLYISGVSSLFLLKNGFFQVHLKTVIIWVLEHQKIDKDQSND